MGDKKKIIIVGGGTVSYIRSHMAMCAPAYGGTARRLKYICEEDIPEMDTGMVLTRMAGGPGHIETYDDMSRIVDDIIARSDVKIVFFSPAIVDYKVVFDLPYMPVTGHPGDKLAKTIPRPPGDSSYPASFFQTSKIVNRFRKDRKDLFLVAFKQTEGLTEDEQYLAGLKLCKESSANLVLANDTTTELNMVITPEEARYHVTYDREEVLRGVVDMAKHRSHLTFTRSTVISGEDVDWSSDNVPESLRTVVDHCISEGAYKPFNGATVGHFAYKINDTTFLTSKRRTNFNDLQDIGLVKVETDGPDTVIAYGAKPSVGGQSQRIIFNDHENMDCVVHFHSPKKDGSLVPERSQYEVECGSHECGKNTSDGLESFGNLKAVYLQEHGPNIVFNKNIDPKEVIDFIDSNFDLSKKTGGYVSIEKRINDPALTTYLD